MHFKEAWLRYLIKMEILLKSMCLSKITLTWHDKSGKKFYPPLTAICYILNRKIFTLSKRCHHIAYKGFIVVEPSSVRYWSVQNQTSINCVLCSAVYIWPWPEFWTLDRARTLATVGVLLTPHLSYRLGCLALQMLTDICKLCSFCGAFGVSS